MHKMHVIIVGWTEVNELVLEVTADSLVFTFALHLVTVIKSKEGIFGRKKKGERKETLEEESFFKKHKWPIPANSHSLHITPLTLKVH